MKAFITFIFLSVGFAGFAQWSNTTNQFYDSLHMPVTRALADQESPIVLQSYPDSGYFVIWQDSRNNATTYTDIYAQKYDKNGTRLWTENGAPVATGPNYEYYNYGTNTDYRTRSFAATDSAGGFYLCYTDDSSANYTWYRIAVQHMRVDGSAAYGPVGTIVATTPVGQTFVFGSPQLIADGKKGFFLSYLKNPNGLSLYVNDYREENGALKLNGGNVMNQNAVQYSRVAACGIQTYIDFPTAEVKDYHIWPDGQGGCNVVMSLHPSGGYQGEMLGYNKVWRAKKDSRTRILIRNETGASCPQYSQYKKDSLYTLYQLKTYFTETRCYNNTVAYVVTNTFVSSNGFQVIDQGAYDYTFPKGITLPTDNNINVAMVAASRRLFVGGTVDNATIQGYSIKEEKFDSIPYQRASFSNPNFGYNPTEPDNLTPLTPFRDTLLAFSAYSADFSMAGGGTHVYATGLMKPSASGEVRLQHLLVHRIAGGPYLIEYLVPKAGQLIGRELRTGNSSTNISYDGPLVTVTPSGFALFSIREYYVSTRVSPIGTGAQLLWGAMGRTIGSGAFNSNYYTTEQPVIAYDPGNRSAVVAWKDSRYIPPTGTSYDIYMRHLDNLNNLTYTPPVRAISANTNPYSAALINPIVLTGSSQSFTPLEYTSNHYVPNASTIAEVKDDYNLGSLSTYVYLNPTAIRQYNGQPYLNRNLLIKSEFAPPAGAGIGMRFYFTKQEFIDIKAADNSISTPGDLAVIYQPNSTTTTPTTYAPVSGEKILGVERWDSVAGGYYVEFKSSDVGNFFVMKATTAVLCPGGSTTIPSSLTGSSYQWQINNTGSGFSNITNGTNYSGVTTATLGLTAIPSFWYGFKYRCLVDGNPSNVISLRFLANWTGSTSTDWNTAGNWGCGVVPDANTDVMINSGSVILDTNGTCRTLTVKPGASFRATAGHNLVITH